MSFGKENGKFIFWIRLLTIEFYYPKFTLRKTCYAACFPTSIVCHIPGKNKEWWMDWSFVMNVFGFGLGFAWKHCDNPNIKD